MAIRTIVRACVLLAVVPALLLAGNRSGSVSGQFLKIPTSARAVGMGGALVSLAEGAGSIAFNPAGMLSIPNASFSGMYNHVRSTTLSRHRGVPSLQGVSGAPSLSVNDRRIAPSPSVRSRSSGATAGSDRNARIN